MKSRLAVVMPVHNALPFLDAAVESVLAQSFGDFEFVILDDGSTDGSTESLRDWARRDRRIRLIEGGARSGAAASSNRVVRETGAPIVARMDADDVARPDRLQRQLAVLTEQPDAVLVGSLWDVIDQHGRKVREADRSRLLRVSPFAPFSHPTIMFRRDAFERIGGYRAEANRWEDVDLYLRFAAAGRILVVTEPLVSVRHSHVSTRLRDGQDAFERSMNLMYCCLAEYVRGQDYSPILRGESGPGANDKLMPPSFITVGSPLVWAGERPRILRRLASRGLLRWSKGSAIALAWAAWADLSPKSLRRFLQMFLKVRNAAAQQRLAGKAWVEWTPPRA